jgi:hypothetical protein
MILLITYDLKRPGQQYPGLYDILKSSGWWWHHLDSTWIVKSPYGPQYWYERLSPLLDQNDFVFVTELKRNYWGFLPKEAWDWLQNAFNTET